MAARTKKATGAGGTIKVRATAVCFYGDVRHRIGDIFTLYPRTGTFTELELDDKGKPVIDEQAVYGKHHVTKEVENKTLSAEEQFNPKCMERVADDTPEKTTSAQERIAEEHDRILKDRLAGGTGAAAAAPATGQQSVLGDD